MKLKIYFPDADALMEGIQTVAEDLAITVSEPCCADLTVSVKRCEENRLEVDFADKRAVITYGRKVDFYRALMLLCMHVSEGKQEVHIEEKPFLDLNGMQLDLSRNNALNAESIRYFIRQHALLGLNSVTLYMEDMFTLPDEPYFGYMRGRYSPETLRQLDEYAHVLGVELIPELELLGHMGKFLRHHSAAYLRGATIQEFLVGEKTTYDFIEKIVKVISSCFRSRLLYIGLDETRTINQGPYRAKHGDVPIEKVFFEHAHKVCKLVNDYGKTPVISGDMPFEFCWKKAPPKSHFHIDDHVELSEDVIAGMPKNTAITMWNYNDEDEEKMRRLFRKTKQLCDEVVYMGSARMYQSLLCKYKPTVKTIVAGMKAAKKENIKTAVFCTWQDSAECPHFLALPAGMLAAEMDYVGAYSWEEMDRKTRFLYGVGFEDFYDMGDADHVHGNEEQELATKFLLYNDPLIGLMDYHVQGLDLRSFYGKLAADYVNRGNARHPGMKLAFDQYKAFLEILRRKGDYGVRLKAAYDAKDTAALSALCGEAEEIKAGFGKLMEIDRELFTLHYQGLGFETIETRRATMCARFDTLVYKVEKLLAGQIDRIDELEQERLPFNCNPFENESENIFFGNGFSSILSVMM